MDPLRSGALFSLTSHDMLALGARQAYPALVKAESDSRVDPPLGMGGTKPRPPIKTFIDLVNESTPALLKIAQAPPSPHRAHATQQHSELKPTAELTNALPDTPTNALTTLPENETPQLQQHTQRLEVTPPRAHPVSSNAWSKSRNTPLSPLRSATPSSDSFTRPPSPTLRLLNTAQSARERLAARSATPPPSPTLRLRSRTLNADQPAHEGRATKSISRRRSRRRDLATRLDDKFTSGNAEEDNSVPRRTTRSVRRVFPRPGEVREDTARQLARRADPQGVGGSAVVRWTKRRRTADARGRDT